MAVVITALVLALVGALGVSSYARSADARALAGQETVTVYVAKRLVPAGTTQADAVDDGLLVPESIARAGVPEGALTTIDQASGPLVATSTIQPGELVLSARFAARAATGGTLAVPSGMLAVSVALDDASHVGPFVTVGTMIAVFDTFNVQESDKSGRSPAGDRLQDRHEYTRATRVLLASTEVLAVGATTAATAASATAEAKTGAATATAQDTLTLFTLAVTPQEAERLVHAGRTGTLTFALLGPDAEVSPGVGTDDRRLFQEAR